jgi:hypothetical protein
MIILSPYLTIKSIIFNVFFVIIIVIVVVAADVVAAIIYIIYNNFFYCCCEIDLCIILNIVYIIMNL